jgi:hypothetical protein
MAPLFFGDALGGDRGEVDILEENESCLVLLNVLPSDPFAVEQLGEHKKLPEAEAESHAPHRVQRGITNGL